MIFRKISPEFTAKQRTSTSPCHSSSPNAASELTQWKAAEEELRGGRQGQSLAATWGSLPAEQMGAFCRHAAGSSCRADHTRLLCLENSTAYNYSFDHVKRAVTVHLNHGFAGNYQFEQGNKAVRTASPRKGLTYKFIFYSFFFLFNLYIFQPNCAAVRTRKSFQELLSLLLAKWKSCAVFAFRSDSCPKTALQRFLLYLHCSTTTLVSQPQSPPAQDLLLFAILSQ